MKLYWHDKQKIAQERNYSKKLGTAFFIDEGCIILPANEVYYGRAMLSEIIKIIFLG